MKRFTEWFETCEELIDEIRQELIFYSSTHAHVASYIQEKISILRALIESLPIEAMKEHFLDYEAEMTYDLRHPSPYEDLAFKTRIEKLLSHVSSTLTAHVEASPTQLCVSELTQRKQHLLLGCRWGSKSWTFLSDLSSEP